MPHIIIGTAGHIDHGKTALVKALTGIDPDRLKEEKERGITIDIGFANLPIDAATTLGFVDVPGHERFVKNMLAGVGGIDIVMLVVAADESVMPQTREHLDICSLLRIKRGLTVLTKIDAADPDLADLAEIEVLEYLKGTFLEGAPIVRVSSATGEGIPALAALLADMARTTPERDASQILRLPIDRCFTMRGFGTVVSGTLVSGRVERDQEVELLPPHRPARVRGIQVHGASVDFARAGQRTALNLQRVELGDIERGMVVVPPGIFTAARAFDVELTLLASAPAPILRRKRVRVHVGTAEVMGYAVLLGQDTLTPGESGYAQILLEQPAFALPGDRFIVRQYSPMVTIGGGEILDAAARRHRRSDPYAVARLEVLKNATIDERTRAYVREAGLRGAGLPSLVARLGVTEEDVRVTLLSLGAAGAIEMVDDSPPTAVSAEEFARASAALVEAVARFHQENPLEPGIGREELKARAARDAAPVVFRAALERLVAAGKLTLDQDLVRAFHRTVTLGGEEARIRALLTDRFRTLGLQAAPIDDVIGDLDVERKTARQILQLLLRENVLVKINEETAVERTALQKLIDDVRGLKSVSTTLGVREFKELTGLSRKFAMPLLEYLDSQRITRRLGDGRVIL
jgi:selenocysteine-specific elongation factor